MYRCENCGNLFEEGEQAVWEETHGLDSPPYEKWSGCPLCKGDYEEVHQCKKCGDWHTDDELYGGWCENCLRETINYDTFFDYCMANDDENYLEIFVLSEFMGGMDCPKFISYDFHQWMVKLYKDRAKEVSDYERYYSSNGMNKKHHDAFIDSCIRFIMDDDGSIGRENYADWLNKREVKK